MAFTIRIYEKDEMVYRILEGKFKKLFPDAFIRNGGSDPSSDMTSDDPAVRYVYDNCQFDGSAFPSGAVPLRKGSWIDIRPVLENLAKMRPSNITAHPAPSPLHILFPFAYIEERESFIDSFFGKMRDDCDIPVRLDLMSSMRMTGEDRSSGSLTPLLKASVSPSFPPDKIPEYLNPSPCGFLTPGLPDSPDDVFDLGMEYIEQLIDKLKQLASSINPSHFILVVAEGFRTNDMNRLCSICPCSHILLPSRMNAGGMEEAVASLKRASGNGNITLHYAEDLRRRASA